MKLITRHINKEEYPDCPLLIPYTILNEYQAQRNHGQSLARLNERGGLAPCEAVAIIERRLWHKMPIREAIDILKGYIKNA